MNNNIILSWFRLYALCVGQHPLHLVGGDPDRLRELRREQSQHPEEGAVQEENVTQRRPQLARGIHKV